MLNYCRGLLALLVVVVAAQSGDDPAAEPKLEYKFDKPYAQTWTTKIKQTVRVYTDRANNKSKEYPEQNQEVVLQVLWTPAAAEKGAEDKGKEAGKDAKDKKDEK